MIRKEVLYGFTPIKCPTSLSRTILKKDIIKKLIDYKNKYFLDNDEIQDILYEVLDNFKG